MTQTMTDKSGVRQGAMACDVGTLPRQKRNKQGKLEHIEDNGFIFKKIN